jgi:hypothetical protein
MVVNSVDMHKTIVKSCLSCFLGPCSAIVGHSRVSLLLVGTDGQRTFHAPPTPWLQWVHKNPQDSVMHPPDTISSQYYRTPV